MSILGAVIVPHPLLIIPTVGCGREQEVQATIDAYRTAAKQVAAWEPEVLVVTSPHQIMYTDYFHISPGRGATGDMSAFGAAQTKLAVVYDAPLREEIIRCGEAAGLQVGTLGQRDPYLDHGTFVPLYFLREAGVDCPILRIGLSGFSPLDHYRLGQCISQAVESLGRRAVFIASGGGDRVLCTAGADDETTSFSNLQGTALVAAYSDGFGWRFFRRGGYGEDGYEDGCRQGALCFLILVLYFLLLSAFCVAFAINTILKDQLRVERKLQSKTEKTEERFKRITLLTSCGWD